MINISVGKNSFGTISSFDNYDLELVQRNNFVVPNNEFKIDSTNIPKDDGFSSIDPAPVPLSRYYTDQDLIPFPLNPVKDSDTGITTIVNGSELEESGTRHHYTNTFVYNNLQRLCYEVLDPVVNIVGVRPNIEQGLIFAPNIDGIEIDSFLGDQIKGNAVVFNFEEDSDEEFFLKALEYILDFSLYDRVIIDRTLNRFNASTIKVSINDNKRKMIFRVKK